MRRIVYYVATSLDGFIVGPNGDASGFVGKGDGVARYLKDLEAFDTVIMGRNTYEFGYKFGLKPGQFAGWLLENQQIDILKIKLNPFIQGIGVSLFGDSKSTYQLELLDTELYEYGLQIMTYKIRY